MKISFLDFWGDFDFNNNFLTIALKQIYTDLQVVNPENSDIIICSVFGTHHHNFIKNKKIIFYTGENIRPNYKTYHKSISFDFDTYNNKNLRIPLWYFYIDWFNVNSYGNPSYLIPVDYLYNENEFTLKEKNKFCCTIFSAPHQDRLLMINKLNEYKFIDCYGKIFQNKIPDGEKIKMDIISNYKFSICFENSIYPGYYTEKLLHAKIAGTIPIYKSHETMNLDFNPNSCINVNNLSLDEVVNNIIEIDNNDFLYKKWIQQPLFENKIEISNILSNIKKLIDN